MPNSGLLYLIQASTANLVRAPGDFGFQPLHRQSRCALVDLSPLRTVSDSVG